MKKVADYRAAVAQVARGPHSVGGLRTLELFSGAGLATEGLLAGGMDVVRCVEWDKDADATARGFGHPSVLGDVRDPKMVAGLGSVGLLWGSPPCQAWSTVGRRLGVDDLRNGFPWFLDAADRVGPRWVVSENVTGLTHHKAGCGRNGKNASCAGCYWTSVVDAFKRRFEHVSWQVLNAADYGAPQVRERVFMVAGPAVFPWPEPTHANPRKSSGLPRWRTIRDVLRVPGLDGWCSETNHSSADYRVVRSLDVPINTIAAGSEGSHTGCGFAFSFGYPVGTTIPVGARRLVDADLDVRGFPRYVGLRRPTVDETALLMGMPSGVSWCGTTVDQRQQVGNGCCPQVVEAIARGLATADAVWSARGAGRTGSRFVRETSTGARVKVGSRRVVPSREWSVIHVGGSRVRVGLEQDDARAAIERAGGRDLEWRPWEDEVMPLEPVSMARSGSWAFSIPRERLDVLVRQGWVDASS